MTSHKSLPKGIADGLEPLGRDGDDHVDGGRHDHSLGRMKEVWISQSIPVQKMLTSNVAQK